MFVYSLAGLELEGSDGAPIEVEENETTARSAMYQVFGRFFSAPDRDHFDRAREGLWRKELVEASALLPFPAVLPDAAVGDDVTPESYIADVERAFSGEALLGRRYTDEATSDLLRSYEYFGLKIPADGPPPDHITIACDYMQYLTFKDAAASSDRLRGSFRRAQTDFLTRYIGPWASGVAAVVRDAGPLAFIGETVAGFATFVDSDAAYLAGA